MKKILLIAFIISFTPLLAQGEKSINDIVFVSQKIANDYLYLYKEPTNQNKKHALQKSIKRLENDFRFIAKNTKDSEVKNVLDFLSYTKDELKELLKEDVTKETTQSLLDKTDALLEGAQSIEKKDNQSLIKFHLMKISKLYMASHLGFETNQKQAEMEEELKNLEKLNIKTSVWKSYKELILLKKSLFVPHIINLLVQDLEG